MVSWTRHSAAPCICRHGPASLSSPRARGIAYTFVSIETYPVCVRLTPYGTRAEESTHAGLAGITASITVSQRHPRAYVGMAALLRWLMGA